MKLSICIPTYNRAEHLENCLNSIYISSINTFCEFEVCISDNNSTDNTQAIVTEAKSKINIRYHKNHSNLGIPKNFLNVVSMASGEFVWLIGDDDLLMPNSIQHLFELFKLYPEVDFFYTNSFTLDSEYLNNFPHPFDTKNLPLSMEPVSNYKNSGKLQFLDLIDPKISFDFLGGMFLSVFKRHNWICSQHVLDQEAAKSINTFSHFDNTFPHIKIFANGFAKSTAYFNSSPLNVCLSGVREWSAMNPLVMSIRLVEALEIYKGIGLPLFRYFYCKNYALRNFSADFLNMFLNSHNSGWKYINPYKILSSNFLYPNFYLSILYFIIRRIRKSCQCFFQNSFLWKNK